MPGGFCLIPQPKSRQPKESDLVAKEIEKVSPPSEGGVACSTFMVRML